MVIAGPHRPIEGLPKVVDAHVSRQNRLHHVLRLCSEIRLLSALFSCILSRCKPIAHAIRKAAPQIALAMFGRLI